MCEVLIRWDKQGKPRRKVTLGPNGEDSGKESWHLKMMQLAGREMETNHEEVNSNQTVLQGDRPQETF